MAVSDGSAGPVPASEPLGQVVASSTRSFVAETRTLHRPPALGSLVRVADEGEALYAVVEEVRTEPLDPGRQPVAQGWETAGGRSALDDSPHLASLLRTTFSALVVGHEAAERTRPQLPPRPAPLYGWVTACPEEAVRGFTAGLGFLSLLVAVTRQGLGDEVIAACLRRAAPTHGDVARAFLVAAGKELALLLAGQPQRLKHILPRMQPA